MRFVLALALTTLAPAAAMAAPVVTLTTPGAEYSGGGYTLGFEFSVNNPGQSITSLGVYDNLGNGLASNAQIGLWDMSGNLLTSTTILAGTGTLDGLFRFQSIAAYALTAGTHYVVGSFSRDLASSLGTNQGGSGSVSSDITLYRDRYSSSATFINPNLTDNNAGGAWLGANFSLSATNGAVPEPATWAMMIGGFGLIGGAMRIRRTTVSFAAA